MVTWSGTTQAGADSASAPAIGVQALTSWRDLSVTTTCTRNPYVLAGHNPEMEPAARQPRHHGLEGAARYQL